MKILIDKKLKKPIYIQIADEIYGEIQAGKLAGGDMLPPVRRLAQELGVNRGTAIAAYRLLESKRLVYTKAGSGTYIAEINPEKIFLPKGFNEPEENTVLGDKINFSASGISSKYFPVKEFKSALNYVLDAKGGEAFGYDDPQGVLELRKTIGERLGTQSSKIHIISGAQQGIDIIARAVVEYGDYIFAEKPTYMGAVGAFTGRGANIVQIPVGADGMDVDRFEKLLNLYKPKLVYLMTYFQTPTSCSYSMQKKRQLIELSHKNDFYIIEEDNLSDFNYSHEKIMSLKSLDYKNKVIYVKSFSKTLMPGLRLGYMILPKAISERAVSIKYSADMGSPGFIQYAFNKYLKSGAYNEHIAKMCQIYGEKYDYMKKLINRYLAKYVYYTEPEGGLSFWLNLKKGNAAELKAALNLKDVIISTEDEYCSEQGAYSGVRLSFGEISNEDMERGIYEIHKIFA